MDTRAIGTQGERLARSYYEANGYYLLAENYKTRIGEIDLILGRDDIIVFSEVKTRTERSIALPREWVDAKKQRRITAAAQEYLSVMKMGEPFVRFDVVEVITHPKASPTIHCIENAFSL